MSLPPAVSGTSAPMPAPVRISVSGWAKPEQLVAEIRAENPNVHMPELGRNAGHGEPMFVAATTFDGPNPGYAFRTGDLGLGYYRDTGAALSSSTPGIVLPNSAGGDRNHQVSAYRAPTGKAQKRTVAGFSWVDHTLAEWADDDFRVFVGDLGNEVNDDVLSAAFAHYPSFLKSKVIRDAKSGKSKGYGFASFKDPWDMTRALREMPGKYVGNRPIKVRICLLVCVSAVANPTPSPFCGRCANPRGRSAA